MSNSSDFVGRNCPLCGAEDSLETDDARGEVACTECAQVIAMGMEESVQTRFLKDATFEEVDRYTTTGSDPQGTSQPGQSAVWTSSSGTVSHLTRQEAEAALHARVPIRNTPGGGGGGGAKQYHSVRVPKSISDRISQLARLSHRQEDDLLPHAISLAKHYIGVCTAKKERMKGENETAAACFLIAAEKIKTPVPLAELRCLDRSVPTVETRKREIMEKTERMAEYESLRREFTTNLTRYYIRLLRLQRSAYELPCLALLHALQTLVGTFADIAKLSDEDRVVAAVLLAHSEPSLQWDGKPPTTTEASLQSVYHGFAANARLLPERVTYIMKIATSHISQLQPLFKKELDKLVTKAKMETPSRPGLKRERSP